MKLATRATARRTMTSADRSQLEFMIDSLRTAGRAYDGFAAELERLLASADVVPASQVEPDVVTLNSRVEVHDIDADTTEVITLVDRSDSGGLDGNVSVLTPLGAALLGARVGAVVDWRFRWGSVPLRIERILYQPEASGDMST